MTKEKLATKLYPVKSEGVPFLCDSSDVNRFIQQGLLEGLNIGIEFAEWAGSYFLDTESKLWAEDNLDFDYHPEYLVTTEQLFAEFLKHKYNTSKK